MSKETNKQRIFVSACPDCNAFCNDDGDTENIHERLTFEIPGVEKSKILIDVAEDRMRLFAPRKTGNIEYVSEYIFRCPVNLEETPAANYEEGILIVEIPLKCENPYKQAKRVQVN